MIWPSAVSAATPWPKWQKVVSAEKSDIFDVLAYVAFAKAPLTRETRATNADKQVRPTLTDQERDFIAFVLQHSWPTRARFLSCRIRDSRIS